MKQGDCSAGSSWSAAAGALLLSEIVYEVSYYLKGRDTVSGSFVVETADLAEVLLVAYAECVHIVGTHELAALAGVSHDTVEKVKVIEKHASPAPTMCCKACGAERETGHT